MTGPRLSRLPCPASLFARVLACALLCLLAAGVAQAAPAAGDAAPRAPRIGVVTMQPGEVFFERFGHDALVVADPDGGPAISYNFGFFDPSEPDFIGNFVRGRMMYYLVALPLDEDLAQYRDAGRGASIQWLDLPPQQARALADDLAERSRPENARYRYDYFTANCSTMVRDALDRAMGGNLQSQLAGRSRGNSYRSEAVRLASPSPWMWLGFDLGLGPWADQPLSRWQEAFVPMRLADGLREVRNSEGRPLVQAEQELLPQRLAPEPAEYQRTWWPWLLVGLALAGAVFAARRHRRALGGLALPFWLFCGLAGLLLAYLWGWSEHRAAWGNRNLLLLSPLALALLPGAWQLLRGRQPGRAFGALLWAVAAIATLSLPLHWLSLQAQFNMQWIVLLLPVHLALALVLGRRGLATSPR
ncbi:lipoprotein N-acyltransferase Lnb domain-containing protein [Stenotrophomonas acidaminiphila]